MVTAPRVIAIFAALVASWATPLVVDPYDTSLTAVAILPSYLVTLFLHDAGLETVAMVFEPLSPGDGHSVREAGNLITEYLVSVLLVAAMRGVRARVSTAYVRASNRTSISPQRSGRRRESEPLTVE